MNTHETKPEPTSQFLCPIHGKWKVERQGNFICPECVLIATAEPTFPQPQFFCRYCGKWHYEVDRLPTSRAGNFICAECEDKRQAHIARNKAEPWKPA
jgi:hypothetical protein